MDKIVKIVQLQYSLTTAGKQSIRLHNAFLEAGIDSRLLSLFSDKEDDSRVKELGKKQKFIARLDNRVQAYLTKNCIKKFGLFSYPVLGSDVHQMPEVRDADIIYIHWVLNGFLNLSGIEKIIKLNKPVVFFLHDMWTITGGCHHSFTCEKYVTGCNNCQMFPGNKVNDLSAIEFKKKLKLFSSYKNLYFVSPSTWLYSCAKNSLLTAEKEIFHIPNIVDNAVFRPGDKIKSKESLSLPADQIVIAFGAVSIESPYKGWEYLKKSLQLLQKDFAEKKVTVLVFGTNYDKQIEEAIPFETKFMGYIYDEVKMTAIYNAADVVITPSLAESFSLVTLEALCCGTPVVAFSVGGIPDLIDHKLNGYLAKYRDVEDLTKGVLYCLQNNVKGYMLPMFEPELTIKKHLELSNYLLIQNNKSV